MRVTVDRDDDVLLLRVEGVLDAVTYPLLHGATAKALAEQPKALVCDLRRLVLGRPRDLSSLFVLSDLAATWPEVPFFVVCAGPLYTRMERLGLHLRLVVRPSLESALRDAGDRARPRLATLSLDSSVRKARAAREFVGDVCESWGVHPATDSAKAMINELVVHALRNGLEPTEVQMTLQPRSVFLLVRSRPVRDWPGESTQSRTDAAMLRSSVPLAHGLDLPLVESLSRGWGGEPTRDGGEILWCRIDRDGLGAAKPL